jgi:hypothetical protein
LVSKKRQELIYALIFFLLWFATWMPGHVFAPAGVVFFLLRPNLPPRLVDQFLSVIGLVPVTAIGSLFVQKKRKVKKVTNEKKGEVKITEKDTVSYEATHAVGVTGFYHARHTFPCLRFFSGDNTELPFHKHVAPLPLATPLLHLFPATFDHV